MELEGGGEPKLSEKRLCLEHATSSRIGKSAMADLDMETEERKEEMDEGETLVEETSSEESISEEDGWKSIMDMEMEEMEQYHENWICLARGRFGDFEDKSEYTVLCAFNLNRKMYQTAECTTI